MAALLDYNPVTGGDQPGYPRVTAGANVDGDPPHGVPGGLDLPEQVQPDREPGPVDGLDPSCQALNQWALTPRAYIR